ncbi:MAG TPA: glycosyltransferase family 2 protein [Tepidisphaeraceae bacterium]|nr:glycosyltransferase family 2 protein [Tepidisphaeraceae bacterium]
MSANPDIFWTFFALVAYAYVLYPAVIWSLSRLFGQKLHPPSITDAELPTATLLIAAYNEEAVIADRVENALRSDYPKDRFRVVVASDGSSDATPQIVSRYADRGVTLLDYKSRRGKSSVLNAAMAEVTGDLVLLSDANTHFDPDAPRKLARWFRDPSIGAVCGRLVLTDPATGANADGMYWKYETFLKKCESRLGALLGSNGAIYAIRRDQYVPIPPNTIVDDFVIPLLAKLKTDGRIVYDAEAVAREETAENVAAEFRRRARIGAGGFQAIALLWRLLDPRHGWVAFTFFSHKILRWLCPFFLIGMLVTSALLIDRPLYRWLLAAQVAFYLMWPVANLLPTLRGPLKLLRLAAMFTSMNVALLAGFWRWLRGIRRGTWDRTARLQAPPVAASAEI